MKYGKKMKSGLFFGVVCAVALHAAIILFGGSLFASHKKNYALQQVELLTDDTVVAEKPKEPIEKTEEIEAEKVPDAAEIIHNMELSAAVNSLELEAASLSDIEAALGGQAGGGDFAGALSFDSGGRIGGTGKAGAMDQNLEKAFSLSEIDQKPRAVFQAAPVYPSKMRSTTGVVSIIFIVDQAGKVSSPRVEKSTHPEFEKPAVDAIKQWKFEPAIKGGQRVSCKMRVPIRFQPS